MATLSNDAKQAIVEKVLIKDGRTLEQIAKAHHIGRSTLCKWVRQYRNQGRIGKEGKQELSDAERFKHLMATATLDEAAIGAYCREQGIYHFQLTHDRVAIFYET